MQEVAFSGSALVEIQGEFVLRFLERKSDSAIYRVLGFDETIIVQDYRQGGLQAIDDVLASGDTIYFSTLFSGSAFVTIYESHKTRPVLILLQDTFDLEPKYMLYIAIGLPEGIPIYCYLFGRVQQIDEQRYALVGLFSREAVSVVESPPFAFDAL